MGPLFLENVFDTIKINNKKQKTNLITVIYISKSFFSIQNHFQRKFFLN